MSEKRRFLDVWIVEANTVYKEVPFDVVADWVQQGRLLENDMLRPSGTAEWARLGDMSEFAVYVPKPVAEPEPPSPVEPMEPVETGFSWRRRPEPEDSDVDMIPLIDVSLVLLIFFMLTTRDIGGGGSQVPTPAATFGTVVNAPPDSVWVGVNLEGEGDHRVPVYSCGVSGTPAADGDSHLETQAVLLDHLRALLANRGRVELTINANPEVRSGDVRLLTVELEKEPFRSKIERKYYRSERQTAMTWKVREEGSPRVRDGLSLEQVLEGLEEGEWSPTDEVRGPDDRDWTRFENHPTFAEAVALEPLPAGHDDEETNVDMTPLIDVAMVLLVFFILIFTYSVLEKRLDAPNASSAHAGPAVVTKQEVKDQMIAVSAKRENGKTVYRVENKEVPRDRLLAELVGFVRATKHTTLLLEADPEVPHGDTVYVEDQAKGAGMERVLLLGPPEEKKP